ncbi:MAG: glycosyltransferase family 39 protein [Bryobacteraceae bacterium]|jgi:4-amino-4-deoxy-L-arabinose transferase-like glycosyltransferase
MPRKIPRVLWIVLPLAYLLYFYDLGATGLVGPDEPRYASIAREMARSGDWITPRLWGQPWFEKPALLYWMTGAAFRLGIGPDLAPRLPAALMAAGFLVFYWWILRREFGARAAWFATLILGACGGWLVSSQIGVPDLPMTATFSAAMLLALPWIGKRDTRHLPVVAALFGLAVLAKGPVALALAVPLCVRWRSMRDLIQPRVVAPFLAVALPWYLLCYLRNGNVFLRDFFVVHNFERFTSNALMHVQPWWFYVPVLAGLLLPWSPLLPLLGRRAAYRDPRRLFLLVWVVFGMIFFTAATNKLPGYVLPLLPAAAALMALALNEAEAVHAGPWLACCALLLVVFPIGARMLPAALTAGLLKAPLPAFQSTWLLAGGMAAVAWLLESRARRLAAVLSIAAGATAGTVYLKRMAAPELDRMVSARALWREIAGRADEVCLDQIERNWRYGLNYYSGTPLPECSEQAEPLWVRQAPGKPPYVAAAPPGAGAPNRPVDLHPPGVVTFHFRK